MICCLNPSCANPNNPDDNQSCQTCGTPLGLLRSRYYPIGLLSSEGGFSRTYLAEDKDKLNKRCAIKQLAPKDQSTENLEKAEELFYREAQYLDDLGQHPQIPTLYAYFEENRRLYLVQEFIQGDRLDKLQQPGGWSESQIREFLLDVLPVLEFLHQRSVIHRDLKPANIICRSSSTSVSYPGEKTGGQFVLIDFGASKQLAATVLTRTIIGTLGYSPMEQMVEGEAYPASDLYSLGVICFQLLTGASPSQLFKDELYEWVQSWRRHLQQPINDERLDFVLDKLLQKDREQRYQSATQVKEAIEAEPLPKETIRVQHPASGSTNGGWRSWTQVRNVATSFIRKLFEEEPLQPLTVRTSQQRYLTVCCSGKGDYKTISKAIENARAGTRIFVRPGTYREGLIINKPLHIIGDGPVEEIVIESRNSSCILMQTEHAEVRGLTLQGQAGTMGKKYFAVNIPQGELILENCKITSNSLTCVVIHGATTKPAIRGCQIHDSKECGVVVYEKGQGTLENCDIFGNAKAGVEIKQEGNLVIQNCQIHDSKECGVVVYEKGQGTLENCDIFGNAKVGVGITQEGNLVIQNCQIHDGKQSGIYVWDKGQGTIKDCDIFGNTLDGVAIKQQGNPTIRKCRINQNKQYAVFVHDNGRGTIENCDLTGNDRGAWLIDTSSQVQRSGNTV